MSELSFIILLLSDLKRERISFLSTIQILHCSVRDDFMHLIPSLLVVVGMSIVQK